VPDPKAECACRAGYKATDASLGIADGDTTKQWRLPADEGNFRVWVAEGWRVMRFVMFGKGVRRVGK
jgi:hypothetical protein